MVASYSLYQRSSRSLYWRQKSVKGVVLQCNIRYLRYQLYSLNEFANKNGTSLQAKQKINNVSTNATVAFSRL